MAVFVKIEPPESAKIPTVADPNNDKAPAFICPQLSKFVLLKLFAPLLLMPVVKLGLDPAKFAPLVTESVAVLVNPLTVIEDTIRFGSTGTITLPAVIVETVMLL
jgi:hypothetical protein